MKRTTRYCNLRNRNHRKWKALNKREANFERWIVGTIEGKIIRHASLCPVIYCVDTAALGEKRKKRKRPRASTTNANSGTPKIAQPQKKNEQQNKHKKSENNKSTQPKQQDKEEQEKDTVKQAGKQKEKNQQKKVQQNEQQQQKQQHEQQKQQQNEQQQQKQQHEQQQPEQQQVQQQQQKQEQQKQQHEQQKQQQHEQQQVQQQQQKQQQQQQITQNHDSEPKQNEQQETKQGKHKNKKQQAKEQKREQQKQNSVSSAPESTKTMATRTVENPESESSPVNNVSGSAELVSNSTNSTATLSVENADGKNSSKKSKRKSKKSESDEKIPIVSASMAENAPMGENHSSSERMSELSVDVTTNDKSNANGTVTPHTKCSVDSGVDIAPSTASFSPPAMQSNVEELVQKVHQSFQIVSSTESGAKKYNFDVVKPMAPRAHVIRRRAGLGLLPRDVEYCLHMMETYGDNYEAMTKDERNVYMDDASAIARKIRIFRDSAHYRDYVASRSATPQPQPHQQPPIVS